MEYSYDFFEKSAKYVLSKVDFKPEIAIVLGSCLGGLAEEIEDPVVVEYQDIPNFLLSTVDSHAGKLILGTLSGKKVVCMSGRFHYYEGYDFEQLVIPIRVFHCMGVEKTILTNAAGAINASYRPGDVMVIKGHIKLWGGSPLRGKNVEEFGPRFFDISDMYRKNLRAIALECAKDSDLKVHEGTYYYTSGPQFESPEEINAMRILGADAVGMSTVTEALTAAHCNMPLLALSLLTNMAAGVLDQPVTTEEVDETADQSALKLRAYVRDIVAHF
ncbi:MAG: purine-nucleoside phosphorylase [Eubacteriales bacterium]